MDMFNHLVYPVFEGKDGKGQWVDTSDGVASRDDSESLGITVSYVFGRNQAVVGVIIITKDQYHELVLEIQDTCNCAGALLFENYSVLSRHSPAE